MFAIASGSTVAAIALASLFINIAPGSAEPVSFVADLSGAGEVPTNGSSGTGSLGASYDPITRRFSYLVFYKNLTGSVTMAHFHGPASSKENAQAAVSVSDSLESPIEGEVHLTPSQADDLLAGRWYFNIHTKMHAGGEVRGQVIRR